MCLQYAHPLDPADIGGAVDNCVEVPAVLAVEPDNYLVNPNIAPLEFRAKFPPTLVVTGTRAFDLSPALATHRALAQADVDASLHVFDGHGHCFYYSATTPEAVDAYQTMIRFFRRHLSR